jgi:hypothetical protein
MIPHDPSGEFDHILAGVVVDRSLDDDRALDLL